MPGTIQGKSGWYEYEEQCIRYEVTADGAWNQKEGPVTKQVWKEKGRVLDKGSNSTRPNGVVIGGAGAGGRRADGHRGAASVGRRDFDDADLDEEFA
jgi:hypothetical protein